MELKDRLRELRGRKSQRQCASDLSVKFANYNKPESGAIPNLEILIKIADYYGVTLDYLTGRTNYKDADYKSTSIDTGLTENAIKYIRSMSPEVRDILEPITKDLVEDKDTAKQKFKLLHTITGISTEDIMLLCMVAKLFPERRRSGGYARPS